MVLQCQVKNNDSFILLHFIEYVYRLFITWAWYLTNLLKLKQINLSFIRITTLWKCIPIKKQKTKTESVLI